MDLFSSFFSLFALNFTPTLPKIKCVLIIVCINFYAHSFDWYLFFLLMLFNFFLILSLNILFHLIFVSNLVLFLLYFIHIFQFIPLLFSFIYFFYTIFGPYCFDC
jgi:hypothetical protein